MEERLYFYGELRGIVATLQDMLNAEGNFSTSLADMQSAHEWLKIPLSVLNRNRNALFYKRRAEKSAPLGKTGYRLRAELHPCKEWDQVLMQNFRQEKYKKMVTIWLKLEDEYGPFSWANHLPNRFHFAEVSPDQFLYVGFHYPR